MKNTRARTCIAAAGLALGLGLAIGASAGGALPTESADDCPAGTIPSPYWEGECRPIVVVL